MNQRVHDMHVRYQSGLSLEAVGAEFGLTRERVRQLFRANDLTIRSRKEGLARLNAERRKGSSEVVDKPKSSRHPSDWIAKKYDDDELLDILRQTNSEVGGILSVPIYDEFAARHHLDDGRPWPSHQTHSLRFGSWRKALLAAGLPANPSSPIAGQRVFGQPQCIDAIRHVQRKLGKWPTLSQYESFARQSNGGLPSAATIRVRCGSWGGGVRLAEGSGY